MRIYVPLEGGVEGLYLYGISAEVGQYVPTEIDSGAEEYYVAIEGLALDMQLVGGEFRVGVANRQAA